MERITIGRLEGHPSRAAGCIEPESKRWQLVLDDEGVPHLYLRVQLGEGKTGYACLDDFLHADLTIKGIMEDPNFGVDIPADDVAAACAEISESRLKTPVPCPVLK